MGELNVEKIMEEIRNEIKEKGYTNDMLSFNDIRPDSPEVEAARFEKPQFDEELFHINTLWNVNPNREIVKKPGLKGKCATLFKKLVRKCIRFYLTDIVQDQVNFNAISVRLFNMLNLYMEENMKLSEEVNQLKDEQEILKNQLYQLRNKSV